MGKRSTRRIVVVISWGLRGLREVRRACAPQLRRALDLAVRVTGGEGEGAETLTVYVFVAAASIGALTLAGAFSGGGASELCKVAGAIAVGAIAVRAAIVLVRRCQGRTSRIGVRPLIAATVASVGAQHEHVPAARALQFVCEPSRLWAGTDLARAAVSYLLRTALSRVVKHPVLSLAPMLSPVVDVIDGCQATLHSARFVRQFALTAVELSREPYLLAS
jgi:hypothetical protein